MHQHLLASITTLVNSNAAACCGCRELLYAVIAMQYFACICSIAACLTGELQHASAALLFVSCKLLAVKNYDVTGGCTACGSPVGS